MMSMRILVRRLSQWTRLRNRKLISLKGPGTADFLQGLVTNDIRYFQLGNGRQLPIIYSLMLDQRGRVISDLLLYNLCSNQPNCAPEPERLLHEDVESGGLGAPTAASGGTTQPAPAGDDHIMCECDASLVGRLVQLFKRYLLRRPIVIEDCSDLFDVNCIFPKILDGKTTPDLSGFEADIANNMGFEDSTVFMNSDPRLAGLGYRVLTKRDPNGGQLITLRGVKKVDSWKYTRHLKICGVGEGPSDFPIGECTPLESNGDYLNGVSFHKGCYVGQELTARTHHTGVVRKRLLPILLTTAEREKNIDLATISAETAKIVNADGRTLGKFRSGLNQFGLALVRYEEALEEGTKLFIKITPGGSSDPSSTIEISCYKPWWWSDLELKGFQPHSETAEVDV